MKKHRPTHRRSTSEAELILHSLVELLKYDVNMNYVCVPRIDSRRKQNVWRELS
jgi:hypothetical protein